VKRWQALAALGGLFVLGVVSGALGAHLYYARALDRPPGPPPFLGRPMGHHLERGLDLTPAQRRALRQILAESRREAEQLRGELAPRMREVMQRSEARIREILDPEQRRRFEELQRHHRRRSERFFGGPGHPHGPKHRPLPEDG
jgi:Spy/CpxP family protein refolding chaperone